MLLRVLDLLARRRRRGGHPAWAAVSVAAFLLREHNKRANRDVIALREELRPGESLLITHTDQPQG